MRDCLDFVPNGKRKITICKFSRVCISTNFMETVFYSSWFFNSDYGCSGFLTEYWKENLIEDNCKQHFKKND